MTAPSSRPAYLDSLVLAGSGIRSTDDLDIQVWELTVPTDVTVLREWADRFREAYCSDSEIDALRAGTGKSRSEYLTDLVFPNASQGLGPAVRAGDFTELLLSDFLENEYGLWVPREKYAGKPIPDASIQGVDVIGFRWVAPGRWQDEDVLVVCEVKAGLSGTRYSGQLQNAITDSAKDYLRVGFTLNATKRRLLTSGDTAAAAVVERFQNIADQPYQFKSAAAAVLDDGVFDESEIASSDAAAHNNRDQLSLMVIRGAGLMTLVHALYRDAADGA